MLSRISPLVRGSATRATTSRWMTTVGEAMTAGDAASLSGYQDIDYIISEDAAVIDAVQKFAGYNIGCLATTDDKGKGHFSEGLEGTTWISCCL